MENLERLLGELSRRRVDRIVVLGDVSDAFDTEPRLLDVTSLLRQAGAVGVWGNHDFGLCRDVRDDARARHSAEALEYMATFEPRREIEGCCFSHVEPWLDANDVSQLWHFGDIPDTAELATRSFAATNCRFVFVGHFHRWLLTGPQGRIDWDGSTPISLAAVERCLIVVAPVFDGSAAVFDTSTCELTPIRCRGGGA